MEPASPTSPEAAPLEAEKIDKYADAYLAIEEINEKATQELAKVADPAAAHRVKADAEGAMIEAIERTGLKLQEFNEITEIAATDPALRGRIEARVKERRRI